ncbi:hypothetical protein [Chryseobacterium sp.]|jgi:hypothetical protein|uniref:hypothetical protein n=1 Tax=Chryseobacterium sp. TaxID=1871047 RepID=UPI00283E82EF|nr:hypothetical protein [Chryseobacterium sp.]MDR3024830.1 hypothetical protein [Chryseobacterium sp.]
MIKLNFGIVFLIIFAIIFLLTGFYFFKLYPLFSVIFFIGAIVNSILLYREYCDQKNKISFNNDNIPERIKIKYPISITIVTLLSYSVFPAVAIFGLIISRTHFHLTDSKVFSIIALFISIFIIASYLEIKKKSKRFIIISDKGIQLGVDPHMRWSDISEEKIITRHFKGQDHRRDYTSSLKFLYLLYNNKKIEINIDDFDITDYQLAQILKIFRARFNNSGLI